MKIAILDTDTLGAVDLSEIESLGEVIKYPSTQSTETIDRLKAVDVVITNKVVIDENVLAHTKLKLICVAATGVNNIDLKAAENANIPVKNVAGYSTESVAQHTFTLLFGLLGQSSFFNQYCQSGEWSKNSVFTHLSREYWQLKDKVYGIIGLGNIGRRVAEIASVFGAKVIYYSTSGKNSTSDYERVSLEQLLNESDVVSIHAPLNDNTLDLIGHAELNMMKRSSIILNLGRGGIINELALAQAIDDERIAGAGIDVLSVEPPESLNPLFAVKNKDRLLMTPHIAWASIEARQSLIHKIAGNIKTYLNEI